MEVRIQIPVDVEPDDREAGDLVATSSYVDVEWLKIDTLDGVLRLVGSRVALDGTVSRGTELGIEGCPIHSVIVRLDPDAATESATWDERHKTSL